MAKRLFDLVVATLCAVLLLPLAFLIGIGITFESPGPVIISTRRVGRGGKPFAHYRFRTMAGTPPRSPTCPTG